MLRKNNFVFYVMTAVFLGQSAWAYIPPPRFIVEQVAKKKEGIKTARITSQISLINGDQENLGVLTETTQVDFENEILTSSAAPTLSTQREGRSLLIPGNAFVFLNRPETLVQFFTKKAVKLERESGHLRRWENRFFWVVGSLASGQPELWVEKDSFLVARYLWNENQKGVVEKKEIQFREYRVAEGGFLYPFDIQLWIQDALRLRVRAQEVTTGKPFSLQKDTFPPTTNERVQEAQGLYYGVVR